MCGGIDCIPRSLKLAPGKCELCAICTEGPLGWSQSPPPRSRIEAVWISCGQVTSRKRKSKNDPNVDMMSGLCLVGAFQFGDMGGAELDALRKVASRGFLRIASAPLSCRHGCESSIRGLVDLPISATGPCGIRLVSDALCHRDECEKGLYTVPDAAPPDPEMIYRFTMSVLAGQAPHQGSQIRRKKKRRRMPSVETQRRCCKTWFTVSKGNRGC